MPAPASEEFKQEAVAAALIQHREGRSLRQIASQFGITHAGIRKWLLAEAEPQYKAAQQAGLIQRIVDADEMLELAEDAVSIARAREMAKFARWDAERRLPHLFGQRVDVSITERVDLKGALEEARARTFEGKSERVPDAKVGNAALLTVKTDDLLKNESVDNDE